MKKIITCAIAALLSIVFAAPGVSVKAQSVNNFVITTFEADYYLSRDPETRVSKLDITEKIEATFPGSNQNHGIERAIPERIGNSRSNRLELKVVSVKDELGQDRRYQTRSSSGNRVLRIGDPDSYVHGRQVYSIRYQVQDVITFENTRGQKYGYDEWYWDVNGTEWKVPFEKVTARLHLPSDIRPHVRTEPAPSCYIGSYGSTERACAISTDQGNDGGSITTISANRELRAGESTTFALAFTSGTFSKYVAPPPTLLEIILMIAFILVMIGMNLAIPLITILYAWNKWKQIGKDPAGKGVIIPQYTVPKGLNPILSDIIINERSSAKAVSATIIELCVRGYLKLYEIEKKGFFGIVSQQYELEIIRDIHSLDQESRSVIDMLYDAPAVGARVQLNTLSNTLYVKAGELGKQVTARLADQGYFEVNPDIARKKYQTVSIVFIILGFVLFFVLLGFGLFIAGIILLVFAQFMPKRTPKGVEEQEYLLGLKAYMELAEAERLKMLQAPSTAEKVDINDTKKVVKLYEKLLPYAILFGIEKQWAAQFAKLYTDNQSPDWYVGSSGFNPVLFSGAITGFNTVATSSFAPPSSSDSSGSGGGGFSGGGGGGGGGGGW